MRAGGGRSLRRRLPNRRAGSSAAALHGDDGGSAAGGTTVEVDDGRASATSSATRPPRRSTATTISTLAAVGEGVRASSLVTVLPVATVGGYLCRGRSWRRLADVRNREVVRAPRAPRPAGEPARPPGRRRRSGRAVGHRIRLPLATLVWTLAYNKWLRATPLFQERPRTRDRARRAPPPAAVGREQPRLDQVDDDQRTRQDIGPRAAGGSGAGGVGGGRGGRPYSSSAAPPSFRRGRVERDAPPGQHAVDGHGRTALQAADRRRSSPARCAGAAPRATRRRTVRASGPFRRALLVQWAIAFWTVGFKSDWKSASSMAGRGPRRPRRPPVISQGPSRPCGGRPRRRRLCWRTFVVTSARRQLLGAGFSWRPCATRAPSRSVVALLLAFRLPLLVCSASPRRRRIRRCAYFIKFAVVEAL